MTSSTFTSGSGPSGYNVNYVEQQDGGDSSRNHGNRSKRNGFSASMGVRSGRVFPASTDNNSARDNDDEEDDVIRIILHGGADANTSKRAGQRAGQYRRNTDEGLVTSRDGGGHLEGKRNHPQQAADRLRRNVTSHDIAATLSTAPALTNERVGGARFLPQPPANC